MSDLARFQVFFWVGGRGCVCGWFTIYFWVILIRLETVVWFYSVSLLSLPELKNLSGSLMSTSKNMSLLMFSRSYEYLFLHRSTNWAVGVFRLIAFTGTRTRDPNPGYFGLSVDRSTIIAEILTQQLLPHPRWITFLPNTQHTLPVNGSSATMSSLWDIWVVLNSSLSLASIYCQAIRWFL